MTGNMLPPPMTQASHSVGSMPRAGSKVGDHHGHARSQQRFEPVVAIGIGHVARVQHVGAHAAVRRREEGGIHRGNLADGLAAKAAVTSGASSPHTSVVSNRRTVCGNGVASSPSSTSATRAKVPTSRANQPQVSKLGDRSSARCRLIRPCVGRSGLIAAG